jgi:hypothetical protein
VRRKLVPRPSAGLVVALVALFVALGGSAVAKLIITGSSVKNGSLTGVDIKKGSVTGNNIKKGSLTGNNIKNNSLGGAQVNEGSLSKVPSAGNADTVGGKGASSFQAADRTALIAGNATGANVLFQSGGFSVQRVVMGEYLVDAGQSVAGKQLSATASISGGASQISVAPCGGNANNPGGINCPVINDNSHVLVLTRNGAGTLTEGTFYLSIGG